MCCRALLSACEHAFLCELQMLDMYCDQLKQGWMEEMFPALLLQNLKPKFYTPCASTSLYFSFVCMLASTKGTWSLFTAQH